MLGSSQATIDLSQRTPDYFSCKNCVAYSAQKLIYAPTSPHCHDEHSARFCLVLQDRGVCRAMMLARALETGAVQVHLVLDQAPVLLPAG
jgi:hypothetical protein